MSLRLATLTIASTHTHTGAHRVELITHSGPYISDGLAAEQAGS